MATVRPPPVCGPLERPSKTSTSFPTLSIPPPSPPNYRVVLPNCKRVVRDRRCSESVGIISGPWVFFLPEVTQRDRGRNWSLATIKPTKTVFGFIRGLAFGERHMRMKGRKWTEGDFPTQKKKEKESVETLESFVPTVGKDTDSRSFQTKSIWNSVGWRLSEAFHINLRAEYEVLAPQAHAHLAEWLMQPWSGGYCELTWPAGRCRWVGSGGGGSCERWRDDEDGDD